MMKKNLLKVTFLKLDVTQANTFGVNVFKYLVLNVLLIKQFQQNIPNYEKYNGKYLYILYIYIDA